MSRSLLLLLLAIAGVSKAQTSGGGGSSSPTGNAGGDLSGTYPSPTIAKATGPNFNIGVSTLVVSGGNVGIGNVAPAAKLHISSGTIILDGTGSPATAFVLCLAASGALGHCTAVTALTSACICVSP